MTSQEIADSLVAVEQIPHTTTYMIWLGEVIYPRVSLKMADQQSAVSIAAAIKAAIIRGIDMAQAEARPKFREFF